MLYDTVSSSYFVFFPRDVFIDFRKRGREKETGRGKNIDVRNIDPLPPVCALTWGQTCNTAMCPAWGSNLQPFGVWDNASTD